MRPLKLISAGFLALGSMVAGGDFVHADDTPVVPVTPPVGVATSTFTLPLLGAPLMVDVTTDAGGGLVEVALNPPEPNLDYTATKVKPNKVRFVSNADGTYRVQVSAKHGGERVSVRAGSLDDLDDVPGGWSGDLFGDGSITAVTFNVVALDDGPDITDVTVDSADPGIVVEPPVKQRGSHDDDDDDETRQWARVSIEFSKNGQTRTLTIKVTTETDDGETSASLKIGLSRVKGLLLDGLPVVGEHTWSGPLCDGTPGSIVYDVNLDGKVTVRSVTVDSSDVPLDVNADDHKATVRFPTGEQVSIKVSGEGEAMTVGTATRIRCARVDPVLNTLIDESSSPDHEDRDREDGDHEDHDHEDHDHEDDDHEDHDHEDHDHEDDDHEDDDHEDDERVRDGRHGDD